MNLGFLKAHLPKKRAAITVAAVILVAGVVAGRERPSMEIIQARAPAAAIDHDIDLDKLRRGEARLPEKDPFAGMRSAEPKAPAVSTAPARPAAPPLPFQYIGKWTQGGKTDILVMRGDELLAITPGQKLGDYRVDQIGDSKIGFTYLPLNTRQTLDLPEVN